MDNSLSYVRPAETEVFEPVKVPEKIAGHEGRQSLRTCGLESTPVNQFRGFARFPDRRTGSVVRDEA
jgi:hypothetical protein